MSKDIEGVLNIWPGRRHKPQKYLFQISCYLVNSYFIISIIQSQNHLYIESDCIRFKIENSALNKPETRLKNDKKKSSTRNPPKNRNIQSRTQI